MLTEALKRIGDFVPEVELRKELLIAVSEVTDAHRLSREVVAMQPIVHQDAAIEAHGNLLKTLAESATGIALSASNYNEYGPGPHYVEVGSGYWFNFKDQRLVQRTWRKNRLGLYQPDFENAPDATARDWYTYGVQVVDNTMSAFQRIHQLPKVLRGSAGE